MRLDADVLVISAYFVLWALVHSLFASRTVKRAACRMLGPSTRRWYRVLYVLFAVVSVAPLPLLVAVSESRTLYSVSAPWSWMMVGGQVLAGAGVLWTVMRTSPKRFLGIAQLVEGESRPRPDLQVRGFYRLVRHPMYSFSIVLIWLTPQVSIALAALYGLMTVYFVVGSMHEERLLADEFGPAYERYRRSVPGFVPRPPFGSAGGMPGRG